MLAYGGYLCAASCGLSATDELLVHFTRGSGGVAALSSILSETLCRNIAARAIIYTCSAQCAVWQCSIKLVYRATSEITLPFLVMNSAMRRHNWIVIWHSSAQIRFPNRAANNVMVSERASTPVGTAGQCLVSRRRRLCPSLRL